MKRLLQTLLALAVLSTFVSAEAKEPNRKRAKEQVLTKATGSATPVTTPIKHEKKQAGGQSDTRPAAKKGNNILD